MAELWKYIKKSFSWAFSATGAVLFFVPDYFFDIKTISLPFLNKLAALPVLNSQNSGYASEGLDIRSSINILTNRLLLFCIFWILFSAVRLLHSKFKKKVRIKGKNYEIVVQYGDILKMQNCKKIISFDECFTTEIGEDPWQIKLDSVCGQYLRDHSLNDQERLEALREAGAKPQKKKSDFRGQDAYKLGTIIKRGDFLLMAFAKLDSNGRATFKSLDEYLKCLDEMWHQIDKYYADKDVCVPILGSKRTKIGDRELTQQELLDIMIESYKISPAKLAGGNRLIIVCRKNEGFSLGSIGETL